MLAGCGALTWTAITWAALTGALRIAPRLVRGLASVAAVLACAAAIAAIAWIAGNTSAPHLDDWSRFVSALEGEVRARDGFAVLEEDPLVFVDLESPPFFDHASAARIPELPEGRTFIEWALPSGRSFSLDRYGLRGASDRCFLSTGDHVVVLESSRGALLLRRSSTGGWRACSAVGSDHDGLRVSQAHFDRYGAPAVCAWILAMGAMGGATLLGLGWRARRAASSVERMKMARAVGDTARLEDGTSFVLQRPSRPAFTPCSSIRCR